MPPNQREAKIPNTIDRAFYDCTSLTSITIPNSVTSIGSGAFGDCTSLTGITVDENNKSYSSQDGILYNKDKTEIIEVPLGIKGSITIPDSVTFIGSYAFENCTNLESITIPGSVTFIGYAAFRGCTSLESVMFENTTGWKVSTSSNMSNAKDVTVTDAVHNAKLLTDTYYDYYWKRYE